MTRFRTNTAGLDAKLSRVTAELRNSSLVLARQQAGKFIEFTQLASPRDTNRYIRAWAMAGNAAGVAGAPFPVAAVQNSEFRDQLIQRLESQLGRYERSVKYWSDLLEKRYYIPGRTDQWKADAERKLATAIKRLGRSQEELDKYINAEGAIVIFRKAKRGLNVTVRDKVYGGNGWVQWSNGLPLVVLHNKEGHASIIEKQHRVVSRGRSVVRGAGGKLFGRAYTMRLAKVAKG